MLNSALPERWMTGLVARLCGPSTARRAFRHALRLYPSLARADWHSCRLRFLLRTLWYRQASRQWFAFLDATAARHQLVRMYPDVAEKIHRPYRRMDWRADQRLNALRSHFETVERLGWLRVVLSLCRRPATLATVTCKGGATLHLVAALSGQFAKEGELCLHLQQGERRLYSVVFSLGALQEETSVAVGGTVVDVGCVQGPRGDSDDASTIVRHVTKALHGCRPRDFMMAALRCVAELASAERIIGVGAERHIYRHWRKRKSITFDYDGFWAEQCGQVRSDGDYEIVPRLTFRSLDELPSKKRAEARRRRQLLIAVRDQILASTAAMAAEAGPILQVARECAALR